MRSKTSAISLNTLSLLKMENHNMLKTKINIEIETMPVSNSPCLSMDKSHVTDDAQGGKDGL